MLIRFVVSNFLSFNKEQEFNMLAGNLRTHKHHVYKAGALNVLKATAMYGANGAGKSNFIKAIDFLKNLVVNGELKKSINSKKFKLNNTNQNLPVELEIEFFYEKKFYAYGLKIDGLTIEEEWLCLTRPTKEDILIFERTTNQKGISKITFADKYLKTAKFRLLVDLMEENILKRHQLLLGKADTLKVLGINQAKKWISEQLYIIYPNSKFKDLVTLTMSSPKFRLFANQLLDKLSTGVQKIGVEEMDFNQFFADKNEGLKEQTLEQLEYDNYIKINNNIETFIITKEQEKVVVKRIVTIHNDEINNEVAFNLEDESDGTQRLLDFIPAIEGIINQSETYLIDEIDQSLHPALLSTLLEKIMSEKGTKGQLIFTTHESNLLDLNIFRQDEIWFVEKTKQGETQLYSLNDFKPRNDLNIKKGYLKGRFGAIPFLGNLKTLKWETENA